MEVDEIKGKLWLFIAIILKKFFFVDRLDEKMVALKPIIGTYNKPLWFPREIFFRFDQRLFDDLNDAYLTKNEDKLAKLWSEAKRWGRNKVENVPPPNADFKHVWEGDGPWAHPLPTSL